MKKSYKVPWLLIFLAQPIAGYNEPGVNLGLTNFLDGGPLRPQPGFYWSQYLQYYQSNKFLDQCGNLLGGVPSPKLKAWYFITEFIYQFEQEILKANPGFSVVLPAALSSSITRNDLGILDSGSGVGDLLLGAYLQFKPLKHHERHILVSRVELSASFPTGKNKQPGQAINAGNGFYYINPYWAATLYFSPQFAASWRLNYLWNSTNKKTRIKAGQALFLNFDLQFEAVPKLWLGINAYTFQQLQNDKLCGVTIPHSKETVTGLGPGFLYSFPKDFDFFGHLYFEKQVRNRPQGISFILRLFKYF